MKTKTIALVILLIVALSLAACSASPAASAGPALARMGGSDSSGQPAAVSFTLKTGMAGGKMSFTGVGGKIDGMANPTLQVNPGDTVVITLLNGDGIQHDVSFPDFNATSSFINSQGSQTSLTFKADKSGTFAYFCTVPGHRQAGMEGQLIVGQASAASAPATAANISRDPADLPGPIVRAAPLHVRFDLEADELTGQLAPGVTYRYWTFNGKVPGPFLRVRVGDTVEVHLKNPAGNMMSHSIDLHAVLGPGGGALMTETPPGGETSFTFKALNPGLFVYHCATPMPAEHIANGMYGMILVEPQGGLAPVDQEFYVMQGEIYTTQSFQQKGQDDFSLDKLMNEAPEFYVFNGATDALTTRYPLHAKVGQTVRIFFGDGGPNKISSFHVIGEILDKVYDQGSLTSPPLTAVQTTLVPPGGAAVMEMKLQVPGRFMLVDHALVRMARGLSGFLMVDGPANPDLYQGTPQAGSGH